jgi:2-octaprenyl-6-methoxyphenol hydroxylase
MMSGESASVGSVEHADVVISGSGFVGTALAAALAQAGLVVVVADPALSRPVAPDPRASTVVAGARRLLQELGAWDAVDAEAEPMLGMEITDGRLAQVMRPVYLSIHGEAAPGEPFAHVVPNGSILAALREAALKAGVIFRASALATIESGTSHARAVLADGSRIDASLLVAADGVRSHLRSLAGITANGWSYDQAAIVTNISLEKPHGGVAVQHFLEGGPFALLPLRGGRASVVWSERKLAALRLSQLGSDAFREKLQARAGQWFGEVVPEGPRTVRPLEYRIARSFVGARVALIGDAAHAVHPIAGQGLNIGLKDVAALAETLVDAARLGSDIGSPDVLARYDRWRRPDALAMTSALDGLVRLFTARSGPVRLARDVGLGLVDRMPRAKRAFIRSASGFSGDVPRLMRGEAL